MNGNLKEATLVSMVLTNTIGLVMDVKEGNGMVNISMAMAEFIRLGKDWRAAYDADRTWSPFLTERLNMLREAYKEQCHREDGLFSLYGMTMAEYHKSRKDQAFNEGKYYRE